ncbi:MAG TPA: hypothetical protein VJ805_04635 [Nitrospiraceae bacterium]|nr:hypothetical protein [Nitrospiraceae bacterium]
MRVTRSSIIRVLGYLVIASLLYASSISIIYVLSSFLLTKRVVLRYGILRDFQKDFYVNGGYRKIWQLQKECVTVDDQLIYVPRIGSCRFANPEFDTTLHFEETGRYRNSMPPKETGGGIVLLGDSQAMGWGVHDRETFANVIQEGLRKPVYNLAVSSYGTWRELLRLRRAALLEKIDTILIQYAGNDLMENMALDQEEKMLEAKRSFEQAFNPEARSGDVTLSKSIRRAFSFAIEKPIRNLRGMVLPDRRKPNPFSPHYQGLIAVLQRFAPALMNKRVIVFSVDEEAFDDFPNGKDTILENLEFVDMKLGPDHFYVVDGHLNSSGHAEVGRVLVRYLSDRAWQTGMDCDRRLSNERRPTNCHPEKAASRAIGCQATGGWVGDNDALGWAGDRNRSI